MDATEIGEPDAWIQANEMVTEPSSQIDPPGKATARRRGWWCGSARALKLIGLRSAADQGQPAALMPLGMVLHERGNLAEAELILRRAAQAA